MLDETRGESSPPSASDEAVGEAIRWLGTAVGRSRLALASALYRHVRDELGCDPTRADAAPATLDDLLDRADLPIARPMLERLIALGAQQELLGPELARLLTFGEHRALLGEPDEDRAVALAASAVLAGDRARGAATPLPAEAPPRSAPRVVVRHVPPRHHDLVLGPIPTAPEDLSHVAPRLARKLAALRRDLPSS
ncbi:MAG: hypothetical protein KC635_07775 [Myxococcales bacterium]|nr:hypothetical protein [Myxococcales bacterium]MCB9735028.1 hypothetical protein [Deltaproteobacteria bacterium]